MRLENGKIETDKTSSENSEENEQKQFLNICIEESRPDVSEVGARIGGAEEEISTSEPSEKVRERSSITSGGFAQFQTPPACISEISTDSDPPSPHPI